MACMCVTSYGIAVGLLSTPQLRARSLSQEFTEGNFLVVLEPNTLSSGLACLANNGFKGRDTEWY